MTVCYKDGEQNGLSVVKEGRWGVKNRCGYKRTT